MTAVLAAYCLYLAPTFVSLWFGNTRTTASGLTRLALISNYRINTLVRDVVILEGERTGPVLVEQDLEMIILTALIVVRGIVLERKGSRGR